jgi:ubiquinone biosynthesis protein UbiJ
VGSNLSPASASTVLELPEDHRRAGEPVTEQSKGVKSINDVDQLQEEVRQLANELDQLEVRFSLLQHKASHSFLERQH